NIANNTVSNNGGAIFNQKVVTVINSTFTNNSAVNLNSDGGAIYNKGNLTIEGSLFKNNYANGYGGVIYNNNHVKIINSNFTSNSALKGGVVYNGKELEIYHSKFFDNTAQSGEAIYTIKTDNVYIENNVFLNNDVYGVNVDDINRFIYSPIFEVSGLFAGYSSTFGNRYYYKIVLNETANKNFTGDVIVTVDDVNYTISLVNGYGKSNGILFNSVSSKEAIINYNGVNDYPSVISQHKEFSLVKSLTHLYNEIDSKVNKIPFYTNITLTDDYMYQDIDEDLVNGITISNKYLNNMLFTIYGNNHTIDGKGKSVLFKINNNNQHISIKDLNIVNGNSTDGGVIYNMGNLEICNCNFTNNIASNNGGVIYNSGILLINGSFFNNNTANNYGGVIFNNVRLSVFNSTFINNSANQGQVIFTTTANRVLIQNNTFMGNDAVYGITLDDTNHVIFNPVFNISLITDSNETSFRIVVTETSNNDNFNDEVNIKLNNKNYNITLVNGVGMSEPIVTTSSFALYDITLNFNGSYNYLPKFKRYILVKAMDNSLTMLSGIIKNNIINNISEITLDKDYIYYSNKDNYINMDTEFIEGNTIIIDGKGHTIDGNGSNKIFYITKNVHVILKNLNIINCKDYDGGAIYSDGVLEIFNCNFTNNSASNGGGAIYSDGVLEIFNCNFINNVALTYGGAIGTTGTFLLNNSLFTNNTARYGGALSNEREATIINSNFTHNHALENGGVFYNRNYYPNMIIKGSVFIENKAELNGGVVYVYYKSIEISRSKFINNSAQEGGAIWLRLDSNITNNEFFNSSIYGLTLDDSNIIISIPKFEITAIYDSDNSMRIMVVETVESNSFNANVSVNIGMQSYIVNLINGIGKSNPIYSVLPVGTYNATIIFNGSDNFCPLNSITEFHVVGKSLTVLNKLINENINNNIYEITLDCNYEGIINYDSANGITINGSILNNKTLTIDGNGHTINGKGIKIFNNINNANVIIKNLNIVNGYSDNGGAIYNKGNLTLLNCNISYNTASGNGGAIFNENRITIINSTFTNNSASNTDMFGGVIYNSGNLTIGGSLFKNNYANGYGGVIYNDNYVKIFNSNFTSNSALKDGGAIANPGVMVIEDSLFENNAVTRYNGGVIHTKGTMSINNTVFRKNNAKDKGGALYNENELTVSYSKFFDNAAYSGKAIYTTKTRNVTIENNRFINNNVYGITLSSTNVFSNTPVFEIKGIFYNNQQYIKIIVTETANLDNFNGDVDVNINGENYVVSLINGSGSNIISNISSFGWYNATVSFNGSEMFLQSTSTCEFLITVSFSNLNEEIIENINNHFYEIMLNEDYNYIPNFDSINGIVIDGNLLNGNTLIIDGNNHILNGNGSARIFNIINNANVIIKNLNIVNGYSDNGGAIYNNGNLTLLNCNITNNIVSNNGGAIFNENMMVIINSSFTNNSAVNGNKLGGAIYNIGNLTIAGSLFKNNYVNGYGGVIYNDNYVKIFNSNFTSNSALKDGGAIFNPKIMVIEDSLFENNTVTQYNGGAIYNENMMTIINSSFTNNSAVNVNKLGGAIYNRGNLTIAESLFKNNYVNGYGGVIYNDNYAKIINSNFTSNNALKNGGAIFNGNVMTIINSTFTNNSANTNDTLGGVIYNIGNLAIAGSLFKNNYVNGYGGVIYNDNYAKIINSNFTSNSALKDGGAIANPKTMVIENSLFENNTVTQYNGGVIHTKGTMSINNTVFRKNNAKDKGGAIYNENELTVTYSKFFDNAAQSGEAIYTTKNYCVNIENNLFINNTVYGITLSSSNNFVYEPVFEISAILYPNQSYAKIIIIETANRNFNENVNVVINGEEYIINMVNGTGLSEHITAISSTGWYNATISVNGSDIFSRFAPKVVEFFVGNTFISLQSFIDMNIDNGVYEFKLGANYTYNSNIDSVNNIVIDGRALQGNVFIIDGNGYAVNGNGTAGVFNIVNNANVIIKNLNIINGNANNGAAIYNMGYLTVINSSFNNNYAKNEGGAIYNGRILNIYNSNFTNNTASVDNGGAIYNEGNLNVSNSLFDMNNAGKAGAIYNYLFELKIVNCNFTHNSALSDGGAIFNMGSLEIEDSAFKYNTVTSFNGGAIHNTGKLSVNNTLFEKNNPKSSGGGIYNENTLNVTYSMFVNNIATAGDAIYTRGYYPVLIQYNMFVNDTIYGKYLDDTNRLLTTPEFEVYGFINSTQQGAVLVIKEINNDYFFNDDVNVTICGETYTITLNHGYGVSEVIHSILTPGLYNVSINYQGSILYPSVNIENIEILIVENTFSKLVDEINYNINNQVYEITLDNDYDYYPNYDFGKHIVIDGDTLEGNVFIIDGNGHSLNANHFSRIFDIVNNAHVIIKNLKLENAYEDYGGAIYNDGNLEIINSNFTNNSASDEGGAIFNNATLSITNSLFTNNGKRYSGVIYNNGNLTINNTIFSNNKGYNGGAIYNLNTLSLYNSAFNDNEGYWHAGAIFNRGNGKIINTSFTNNGGSGNGGAIYTGIGILTIINSTFSNNSAKMDGGSIINYGGDLTIINSNFTNNTANDDGGAIYNNNKLIITNSRLINNHASIGSAIFTKNTDNIIIQNNVFINNTVYGITADNTNKFINPPIFAIATVFEPNESGIRFIVLELNNGRGFNGNVTVTVAGENYTVCLIDGFGKTEQVNSSLNHGKYNATISFNGNDEYSAITPQEMEIIISEPDSFYNLYVMIVENIYNYNYEIKLDKNYMHDSNNDLMEFIVIDGSILKNNTFIIDGNGYNLDGNKSARILSLINNAHLIIKNLKIINGHSDEGIIYNDGTLTILNSTISNNTADERMIYNKGSLSIINSTLTNNSADYMGTVFNGNYCNLTVINSTFKDNRINGGDGGAITGYGNLTIINSIFANNTAKSSRGGAIYCYNAHVIITNSTFTNNTAYQGGALYLEANMLNEIPQNPNVIITNTRFLNNHGEFGGAILNDDNLIIIESIFTNNTADGDYASGGAIYNCINLTIINSTFNNNFANRSDYEYGGGAIYNEYAILTLISTNLVNNHANQGGAIFNYETNVTIIDCEILYNYVSGNNGNGGAIYNENSILIINGSVLSYNQVIGNISHGGVIYNEGILIIDESVLSYNQAMGNISHGGAIYNLEDVNITNSYIIFNQAIGNSNAAGGAIEDIGKLYILNSIFANNTANGSLGSLGGAIMQLDNQLVINNSTFENNSAIGENAIGGAIVNLNAVVIITDSQFKENNAKNGSAFYSIKDDNVNITNTRFIDDTIEGVSVDDSNKILSELEFELSVDDFASGSSVEIIVKELKQGDKFNGNVIVLIGNQSYTVEVKNGKGVKTIAPILNPGEYSAKLTFNETNQYASANAISNIFTVTPRIEPTLIDSVINISSSEKGKIIISLTYGDNPISGATLKYSINNGPEQTATTLNDGTITIITNLTGNVEIKVNYEGDTTYKAANKTKVFNFLEQAPTFIVINSPEKGKIIISLTDENNPISGATLKYSINNGPEQTATTLNDGTYVITTALTGIVEIKVVYDGNNTYKPANNSRIFNFSNDVPSLIDSVIIISSSENGKILIKLTDGINPISGANIKYTINDGVENSVTTLNDGTYLITTNLTGNVEIKVVYDGNSTYESSNAVKTFNFPNVTPTLKDSVINISSPEKGKILIKLTDGVNPISNAIINYMINEGVAQNVTTLNDGSYLITTALTGIVEIKVIYNGNAIYKPASSNNIFNFSQDTPVPVLKTTLTLKSVKVKKSAKKLVLQATLKQANRALSGKKIIFKFNGKKYSAKTKSNGVAKVTIKKKVLKKLKVGKKVKYQVSYGKLIVKKTAKVKR
ncbi:MAG: hypothetical protein E7Z80_02010, partial [Methanobrevibacter thaueri]|nr:hypothetical protein [Methanobrevibacter thaueri]